MLTTLAIFGKLAYPKLDVMSLIGREQMKESKFFQELLEEGRAEGRAEGRIEGRIEERRENLLETLELRFGSGPGAEIVEAIRGINDLEQLAELRRLATTCRRLPEFRQALMEATSRT
jgi:predicted transposase YdaD